MFPRLPLLLLTACAALSTFSCSTQTPNAAIDTKLLARHYTEGEPIAYRMKGSNKDRSRHITYEADARGVVKKDAAGVFYEEFAWTNVSYNGSAVKLTPEAEAFRQKLSRSPGSALAVPDLRPVLRLVGPITDLLTFYADMKIATDSGALAKPGDRFYFKHGTPASWADGFYTLQGEDSIDFDVTLAELDSAKRIATVLVRHVVPAQPQIKLPVEWMKAPVVDTPNNWVQIIKRQDSYIAAVGKEVFDARIRIDLRDGRILGATLDNPVELIERTCTDAAATQCGEPVRTQIMRRIEIEAIR